MAYDRRGRKVQPAATDETAAPAVATPNAARLTRGGRSGAGGPNLSLNTGGTADTPAVQRDRMFRMRVLPLVVAVAALAITVKVGDLWDRQDELLAAFSIGAPAEAAARDAEPEAVTDTAPPAPLPLQLAQASDDQKVDPFSLGKSQIELLQSLAKRREELDEREQDLIQREGLLKAAEHRIENKISELKVVKGEIEDLITTYNEQEEKEIESLVSIYEKMKPKDAARIFDQLDMDVLLDVLQRMKASKTAPVLAAMDPLRAKEVTTRIAERRSMPTIN